MNSKKDKIEEFLGKGNLNYHKFLEDLNGDINLVFNFKKENREITAIYTGVFIDFPVKDSKEGVIEGLTPGNKNLPSIDMSNAKTHMTQLVYSTNIEEHIFELDQFLQQINSKINKLCNKDENN